MVKVLSVCYVSATFVPVIHWDVKLSRVIRAMLCGGVLVKMCTVSVYYGGASHYSHVIWKYNS